MGDQRPGDNLYTSSVLALDAKTGQIKGYHQYHQNDSWDWDEVSPPIIVDYMSNGKPVKGLVDVARDGYLWMLERTADKINFVAGQPFVYHNTFTGVDPNTGHPIVAPEHKPGTGKMADFCPSLWGARTGHRWHTVRRPNCCTSRPTRTFAVQFSVVPSPIPQANRTVA
jgi:alcohol dehydrogenase (cytochrome c)